jgi:hypothetical protein
MKRRAKKHHSKHLSFKPWTPEEEMDIIKRLDAREGKLSKAVKVLANELGRTAQSVLWKYYQLKKPVGMRNESIAIEENF